MTPKYRVLALDLDGTLLTTDKQVTPQALALLAEASGRGMRILFVTGRNLPMARSAVSKLAVPSTVISHNGALVADARTGNVLDADYLTAEAAARLCEHFAEWSCPPFLYMAQNGQYFLRHVPGGENPALRRYLEANRSVCSPAERLADVVEAPDGQARVIHVVSIESRESVTRALDGMPEVTGAVLMTSGGLYGGDYWFLEALRSGVSKLRAVRRVCERWDVGLAEVAAIGDNLNDVDLLRAAGHGIAMGNAPDEVKAAADAVTQTNDEDGVANALAELLAVGPPL